MPSSRRLRNQHIAAENEKAPTSSRRFFVQITVIGDAFLYLKAYDSKIARTDKYSSFIL